MEDRYLFRAKRVKDDEWFYGNYYQITALNALEELYTSHYIIGFVDSENRSIRFAIYENTLSHCTGLKDKNGTLIFSDDVVALGVRTPCYGAKGVIKYQIRACAFYVHTEYDDWYSMGEVASHCEIIGNRHDNPELLKGDNG